MTSAKSMETRITLVAFIPIKIAISIAISEAKNITANSMSEAFSEQNTKG